MIFALMLAAWLPAQDLPPPSEIDRGYRKEYRQDVREEKKEQRLLEGEGWDIILDPIEKVPVQQYDQLPPQSADNWGVRLLLPTALRQRIRTECKYPVLLKITDTGVDVDHPDLVGPWRLAGSNYTTSTSIDDVQGHGTHVAGIATAKTFGIASILADAGILKLKSVKILSDNGSGSFSWVANAYRTERQQDISFINSGGAVVYNGSFGGGTSVVQSVDEELKRSTEAGVVFVFAAGNSNGPVNYPGLSDYSITIASLDQNLQRSSYSCFGDEITYSQPGRGITSTYVGGGYATLSGTSMASPFAAGEACLALAKWGRAKLPTYTHVRDYLEAISDDLGEEGWDEYYGAGIAYVSAILDTDPDDVLDGTPPPPPPPPGDDEPDNPPPPTKNVTVSTRIESPAVFRYRTQAEQDRGGTGTPISWHMVTITSLKVQAKGETATKAYDAIQQAHRGYFYETGKVMVIPNEEGAAEVLKYAPMFWHYWSRDKDAVVYVEEVEGYDEQGRFFRHRLTDEQRGGVPPLSSIQAKVIEF